MVFDFDACEYTNLIKTSFQAFTFADELNSILDTYLDPVLDKSTILPESFNDNIKSSIVSAAETKAIEVQNAVTARLDALLGSCGRRRLGDTVEVGRDGSQRLLTDGLTFGNLAASIQSTIDGVVSFHLSDFVIVHSIFIDLKPLFHHYYRRR